MDNHHSSDSTNLTDGERTPPLSNKQRRISSSSLSTSNNNNLIDNYGSIPTLDSSEIGTPNTETINHNTNIAIDHNKNGVSSSGQKANRGRHTRWPRGTITSTSTGLSSSLQQQPRSERSLREHRLNQWLECIIVAMIIVVISVFSFIYWYYNIHQQLVTKELYHHAVQTHAIAAEQRRVQCFNIDWISACDTLLNHGGASGRRRRQQRHRNLHNEPNHDHPVLSTSSTFSTLQTNPNQRHKKGAMNKKRHGHPNNHHRSHYKSKNSNYHHPYVRNESIPIPLQEQMLLESDDPAVTYDNFCLKVYRLDINHGRMTFPYHSSQLLRLGGNHTMALIIQHGALRNSEEYFCSFKKLLLSQQYRHYNDILVIAPDFNYATDHLVHPNDAVWNSSKPWGDWRVGAESDPYGVQTNDIDTDGNTTLVTATSSNSILSKIGSMIQKQVEKIFYHTNRNKSKLRPTISSFDVIDNILAILTDKKLYPNIDKISFVGHSAGGQMIQRYAILSVLAALWFMDTGPGSIDIEFIIANPSSYTYLDPRRFTYSCGRCDCSSYNCTCDSDCTNPSDILQIPHHSDIDHNGYGINFPCYQWNYDRWPYGIGSFIDETDDGILAHAVPYALRDGFVGVERALRMYRKLDVVYMVGQNDTCNDGLPTCPSDCWKRTNYLENEWPCFRNDMDTRCPAMLQGPCRRTRGYLYMKYLEDIYGEPVHQLHTIPGVGHNATAMFGSDIGMKELFD